VNVNKSQKELNEEKLIHDRFIKNHLKALRDALDEDGLVFYSDHIHYLMKKI
tara:strand:- start:413 stop:568 length:156 start_codon:yes stop_codon:yes gene_type:complete